MANDDDLEAMLKRAVAAVEGAKVPRDLRAAAFAKAFDQIAGVPGSDKDGNAGIINAGARSDVAGAPVVAWLDKIATKLGTTREQAEEIYDVDGEGLNIVVAPARLDEGVSAGARQLALLVAAGRQAAELEDRTDSSVIRAVADDYGKADSNLGKILSAMGSVFSFPDGPVKDRPVRVRRAGFAAAGELVKALGASKERTSVERP